MTPAPVYRPLPLGELLEQLRLEGFAVTPEVYARCFTIASVYFLNGLARPSESGRSLQALKEMLGPVVSRSDLEQEKFGAVFDRVMLDSAVNAPSAGDPAAPPKKPIHPAFLRWGIVAAAILLLGIVLLYYSKPDSLPPPPPDRTITQPARLADPRCVLTIKVQSIEGSTITFLNASPGRNQSIRYRWQFSDGRTLTTQTDSSVVHTFQSLDSPSSVTITASGGTCNQSVRLSNFYRNDSPKTPDFPLIEAPAVFQAVNSLNPWALALVVFLSIGLIGLVVFRYFFTRRTLPPADGPPYFLTFPDQEKGIKVADSMDVWARQLNQRDESQRLMIHLSRSIRATVRAGGYPVLFYHAIKSRPRYLVLIDNRSTFHQQARLYAYLSNILTDSDVELETLFFNADPRTCWGEKYPRGIAIEELYRRHRSSYLVLITEGIRLIDHDRNTVAAWAIKLFEDWEKRALLTPVYPENWTYVEKLLSRFFIVLPATPDGQLLLRAYFQADERPTFQELRRRFSVPPGQKPDRGFFDIPPDALTIRDIDAFLETAFENENPEESTKTLLKQWAYATAVYPTPTWEMTLAIGKAIESSYKTATLVTTTNLLKLTALPWLQQRTLPGRLRQDLLEQFAQFPPQLKSRIQTAVLSLLDATRTRPGSLADEEREMHTYEVWLTDENRKPEALRKLAPYQQAGLLTDPALTQEIRRTRVQKQRITVLTLAVLAILLFLAGSWGLPQQTGRALPRPVSLLYTTRPTLDSAARFNNVAATATLKNLDDSSFRAETERLARAIGYFPGTIPYLDYKETASSTGKTDLANREKERYVLRLAFLMASLRHRVTFEALYNLHALRYEYGKHLQFIASRDPLDLHVLSPRGEVPRMVTPVSWFNFLDDIPDDSVLVRYIKLLNQPIPADSSIRQVRLLDKKTNATGVRLTRQTIQAAQLAGQFNRVNLYLPHVPGPKNILRVRVPSVTLSPDRQDALARIEAARIKMYYSFLPTAQATPDPAVTTPKKQPPTAVKPPAGKQPIRRTPPKNRPSSAPTQTPVQSKPDYPDTAAKSAQPSQSLPSTTYPATREQAAQTQPQTQAPVEKRGIPGEYGVLVGTLAQSRVVNGDLYLLIRANKEEYRVRIDHQPTNAPSDQAVIAIAEGSLVQKIPGFQQFRTANEGFYPLAKNRAAGALDYLRTDDSYKDFKVVNKMTVSELTKLMLLVGPLNLTETRLVAAIKELIAGIWNSARSYFAVPAPHETRPISPENLMQQLRIPEKSQPRVYVWGSRWQPGTDDTVFRLRNGFNEIRYVHMNQGSSPPNQSYNAPWQDGGFIVDGSTPKAVAIRFSSQSTTVDENGDPVRPATAK
ncbi:DUF2278 family protein [Larkinella bovis]|uniref:DUF2278 family protein n=1 Tax=Larkinella bovis TaxID=683041 RepID=A0ABW0IAC6_9BACT